MNVGFLVGSGNLIPKVDPNKGNCKPRKIANNREGTQPQFKDEEANVSPEITSYLVVGNYHVLDVGCMRNEGL